VYGIKALSVSELRRELWRAIGMGAHSTAERLQRELAERAPRLAGSSESEQVA
jgi:hypothetical protein